MAPNENLERGTACLLCRRRKQRCDAVKPVCGPCTRARGPLNCVYTPSRRELLEQKVRELEAHISTIKSSSQQNPASERASRPPSNSPSTITSASSSSSTPRLSSTPDVAAYLYRTGGVITLPVYATQVHRSKSKPPASIPRHLEDPDMTRWKNQKDIPHGIITHLTALFLKFKWRHPVEFNVSRLLASLELPPSHPQAPHPSLRNAILLNGCLYADESFRKYEPLIAEHFSKDLKHSLANADRLFDCVRASAFFGCYLYSRCRMVEAHYYISTSMSLAIACGLNTIQSLNLNDPYTASMLKPAHDLVELGDRINMFWMLFNIDRAGSLLTGVPCGLADQKIDTTWPCPSEYYEDVIVSAVG
ncbi:hypothetical protein BOTBODRAFT_60244 [Botryobasidium botryosum FD-172 SS1]|uniref:Zn(2)-C6 fungal-type domain-containing protein n=1 Tax=Botryobasidium botryosum (strain FD-172 SS1) TaxID=930990 RepID=A0A067LVA6_BOTB1|nr:hypothetical protein BOTBODRAFT_60244 [Botryobasidium botryosum FD-172 SS1]